MAGFIIQVQSAILPFVCTLKSGQPPHRMRCSINPCRACPSASNKPYRGA